LVKKFKQGMNRIIQQKLIELECLSRSIEQWYERVTNLDRHQRMSRREGERLRKRRETESIALRVNVLVNTSRIQ